MLRYGNSHIALIVNTPQRPPAAVLPRPAVRGLSREEAAEYVGIGSKLFDRLVRAGQMPRAKRIGRRLVWDKLALDKAFSLLPDTDGRVVEIEDAPHDDLAEIEFVL